jgi:hypothetical protein
MPAEKRTMDVANNVVRILILLPLAVTPTGNVGPAATVPFAAASLYALILTGPSSGSRAAPHKDRRAEADSNKAIAVKANSNRCWLGARG